MTSTLFNPKIFCEFVPGCGTEQSRIDFYFNGGNLASLYDLHLAAVVRAELEMLGYTIENYPKLGGKK
jgi:hypothetical protein